MDNIGLLDYVMFFLFFSFLFFFFFNLTFFFPMIFFFFNHKDYIPFVLFLHKGFFGLREEGGRVKESKTGLVGNKLILGQFYFTLLSLNLNGP